jgi:hypothetical protein
MPAVPSYDNFRTAPSAPGSATFRAPSTEGADAAARQTSQFGAALSSTSSEATKLVIDAQQQANQLRVIDAENKAREAALHLQYDPQDGYTNIRGGDVMHLPSGKPLAIDYGERYQRSLDTITSGLSNDAQKEAFARSAATLRTGFDADAQRHEGQEYHGYQLSVVEGSAKLTGQEIALHSDDPGFIDQRLPTLDAAIAERGRLAGVSGNEIAALQSTARSTALSQAIAASIDKGDITTARSLFTRYGDRLLAPDKAQVEVPLMREERSHLSLNIADDVFGEIPGAGIDHATRDKVGAAVGVGPLAHAVEGQESGHRAGISGPMTKYGQAHGLMQVLDSTGKGMAEKLGVPWRPELMSGTSEEAKAYQRQIGGAYLTECLQAEGGDVRQALMRYHGGPNRDIWGPKTHAYADDVLRRVGAGSGGPSADAGTGKIAATLEDTLAAARARLSSIKPDYTAEDWRPVEDEVTRRYEHRSQAIAQHTEQTVSGAMAALVKNGGNMAGLSPAQRSLIPAAQYDNVSAFARNVQASLKPAAVATDPATYEAVFGHPDLLVHMNDSQLLALKPKLSESDWQQAVASRTRLRTEAAKGPPEKRDPGHLDYGAINHSLTGRLQAAGLDLKPKAGTEDEAKLGAIRMIVNQQVASQQARLGRPLSDVEIDKTIGDIFLRQSVTHGWTSDTYKPRVLTGYQDIERGERKEIEAGLRQRNIPVTPANVMAVYYAKP